jgi:hypothetical protein
VLLASDAATANAPRVMGPDRYRATRAGVHFRLSLQSVRVAARAPFARDAPRFPGSSTPRTKPADHTTISSAHSARRRTPQRSSAASKLLP